MKKLRSLVCRSSILLIVSLFFCSAAIAQERVITGTVTEGGKEIPVIGGTVMIKGTSTGTSTGPDGKYQITVRGSDDILVFQFIGLTAREVPVDDRTMIGRKTQKPNFWMEYSFRIGSVNLYYHTLKITI